MDIKNVAGLTINKVNPKKNRQGTLLPSKLRIFTNIDHASYKVETIQVTLYLLGNCKHT